jgi:hypothetical protein
MRLTFTQQPEGPRTELVYGQPPFLQPRKVLVTRPNGGSAAVVELSIGRDGFGRVERQ